jgi:hypothetical protein
MLLLLFLVTAVSQEWMTKGEVVCFVFKPTRALIEHIYKHIKESNYRLAIIFKKKYQALIGL